ncbi:unnamed protein product [Peniophora sp. CBMAI 1063]|nr:unnamed protein product [Peniophora sp. CBMAI 1063]
MAGNGILDEIYKIPPVTRFLCGSSLAVSLPAMLKVVHPYVLVFVKDLVVKKFQIWRIWTSFFLGGGGINYIFELVMLYRNANMLESEYFPGRSDDLAWQLLVASAAIIGLNLPLGSFVHNRPLTLCLTYLSSALAPPGAQTSLFGLITLPVAYFPYALIALDLLMGGPAAAAQSVTGAVVGHLWYMGVYGDDGRGIPAIRAYAQAPGFIRALVGTGPRQMGTSGVHVQAPRQRAGGSTTAGRSTGYNWGSSGHRLGSD